MIQREEQQVHTYTGAAFDALVTSALSHNLEDLKREAKRGPLDGNQIKMLRLLARNRFPGSQELLQECLQDGLKKRKRFADIVKETPRQEGETCGAWVRHIGDQCDKYDTNCPTVITEEFLQKYSQKRLKNRMDNLPAITARDAKSFRSVEGKAEEGWQLL